jgi:nicotinamide riboside kinase
MKTITLSGAFNTGKTTVFNEVKKSTNKAFHYSPDGGRAVLEELGTQRGVMSPQEQKDYQMRVCEHYLREEALARNEKKPILSDGYMIETLAYGLPVLDDYSIRLIHNLIAQRKEIVTVIKFPLLGDIKMDDDGLRDTDKEYQKTINNRIDEILYIHDIKPIELTRKDVQGRVEEVLVQLLHRHIL